MLADFADNNQSLIGEVIVAAVVIFWVLVGIGLFAALKPNKTNRAAPYRPSQRRCPFGCGEVFTDVFPISNSAQDAAVDAAYNTHVLVHLQRGDSPPAPSKVG